MYKKLFIAVTSQLTLLFYSTFVAAQTISGIVQEPDKKPIFGASIRWQNAKGGVQANEFGKFSIKKLPENNRLIISMVGYQTDTLMVYSADYLTIKLKVLELATVQVRSTANATDRHNPQQNELLTTKTLAKAACCNLSESFETNASVSVSYADAVTGAKQIQMLGLSGNYVQINTDNIPSIRGLNTTFGLNYIPGTWVSSIDIGKGVGSVVNGYEGMIGAINVELQKPEISEKMFLNVYANNFGRGEINLNLAKKLNKKWAVGLLTHGSFLENKIDNNGDGFLDIPLYKQANFINRWKYQSDKIMWQFGVKYLNENRLGGQNQSDWDKNQNFLKNTYSFGSQTERVEFFSKSALIFQNKPYKGIGLIINVLNHQNDSYFGFKQYTGRQKSFYANLIYQNIINNTNHQYKAGFSYLLDDYNEVFALNPLKRTESVPGIFGEYTYTLPDKLILVLGNRIDFHNLFGIKTTPRVHVKYDFSPSTHLRLAAGKGWRMPNVYAENFGNLTNSRSISILEDIRPELSWNIGGSLHHDFLLFGQQGSIVGDYYMTNFQNQLIVDMETYNKVLFYNLNGRSFSNSFQLEANYQPINRMEVKLAYRYFDVQQDMTTASGEQILLPKMFVNKNRVLFNISYATKFEKWKFDFTWQYNGKRRIPDASHEHVHTINSPEIFAPAFSNLNAQITKQFKRWEMYLGGENLANFTQANPIINAKDPFGKHFDASMVWGPIIGRMIYTGMRWKIK
jgi:outer membrane receptor protein involved in Fe transport